MKLKVKVKTPTTSETGGQKIDFSKAKEKLNPEKPVEDILKETKPKRRRRKKSDLPIPLENLATYIVILPDGLARVHIPEYKPLEKHEVEALKNAWIDVLETMVEPEKFSPVHVLLFTYAMTIIPRSNALFSYLRKQLNKAKHAK